MDIDEVRGAWGYDVDSKTFVDKIRGGSYVDIDQLSELYEQLGNLYYLKGDRVRSEIFYGVMVLLKQQKFSPDEIPNELKKTIDEIKKLRQG